MVPTWPHQGTQILSKCMPKASPGKDFLGARKYSKMCNNGLQQYHPGCIMGSKDYHMVRSAQQLQQSVREFASQWATTQCIHFHFSTIACMNMVTVSLWNHKRRSFLSNPSDSSLQSLGTEATQKSCEVIMQKRSCLCQLPVSLPIAAVQMTS